MKRFFKYIILLALAFIGIYNLIGFFGQSSMSRCILPWRHSACSEFLHFNVRKAYAKNRKPCRPLPADTPGGPAC